MGLFKAIADYRAGLNESQEALNTGVREILQRGAGQPVKPDRFQREMAAYRAEVDAIANGGSEYDGMSADDIARQFGL